MRRLAMDFQPVFMSGHSLRRVDAYQWEQRVRPRVVPQTQATCSICGFVAEERHRIEADEVWAFSSPPHVTLVDVRPLCTRCHEAKDFAQTLVLITKGARDPKREAAIRTHYCEVNGCSETEFDADFAAAATVKRELEEKYGCNNVPEVDYGEWGRPKETPRLTAKEQRMLRDVFDIHGEVGFGGRTYQRLNAAVRALQQIPIDQRAPLLSEIEDALNPDEEEDMWPGEECPWDLKMNKD